MASYHHLPLHSKPRCESPAMVFAKLKSKVQREGMCAKEGFFTGKDPLCNVREKHGADFKSPRKRTKSTWMTDELKENQRFSPYRCEVQALTLSPISSPRKKIFECSYSDTSSKPVDEMPPVTEIAHGCAPRNRAFQESTAVSHPHSGVNRDLDDFNVTNRTPVKIQPVERDCVRSGFGEDYAPLMSSAYVFSPMRKRNWDFNTVSSSTREVSREVTSQPPERKTSSAFSEIDTHNNPCMEDYIGRLAADQSELNQFAHEPMFPPPRSTTKKRCSVFLEKHPMMSPAKMFAYMKKRESKTEQKEGNFHPSRDTAPSTAHSIGEMEDITSTCVPERVAPVNQSRVESADHQSDTDPCEDVLIPAVPSQPVLLEDPLVLNTPRISIPKKNEAVFKRNKWPQTTKFPSESVIHLEKWYLRKNHQGLFVDGIHRKDNIPWNSNIIVDRISNNVLKTLTGSVYVLVGRMTLDNNTRFPKWFLKKFANGFPPNWKALYEKFLSESRDEASSINLSVKRRRQKPFKTPDSCPPVSSSSTKVSRSGRVIKPPLEYWKGGRVILDAHMNVTIHECYNTSICNPEVTTTVSARVSQKPACVFLPCSEGRKQCESASDEKASVPLRRVKAPLHKRNRAKANPDKKPSYSPEPPVETLTSPEDWSGRTTRSGRRCPAAKMTLHTVPQKQSKPEKSSTRRSKEQTHDTTRPSVRVSRRKRAVPLSPESPTVNDQTSQERSSDEGSIRRKTQKRTRATKNKDAAQTKHKRSKCTETSQPAEPLPKSTQSRKKRSADKSNALIPQQQDEDEWTEAELMKLQEAVSFYPKHVAGYWAKVARIVGTHSAEECHNKHTSQGASQTPTKTAKKPKKRKVEAPKDPVPDHPVISARVGTLRRKQQVRQFLETMPREDVDDVFSSAYMQNKRFEIPSMCQSDEHDLTLSDLGPLSPTSTIFPEVKTPQCLHITPGMMGSPNRDNDDKYVFQLQKRMKKRQFNVCKKAPSSKSFTPTPSIKRTMRRRDGTENDPFVVWEMFPGNDGALSESGEEEDFYFSDND